MMVCEKPLTPTTIRLDLSNTHCQGRRHYFEEAPVPPGTACQCGKKVMIYDPCRACGMQVPMLGDVRNLEEGIYV